MTKTSRLRTIKVYQDQNLACLECDRKNIPVANLLVVFGLSLDLCQECILKAFQDYEPRRKKND